MTKTVWERNLNKKVEIIAASGHLTLTEYSMFARIERTDSKWGREGMFQFIEAGPLPPNEPYIEKPNPTHNKEEAQFFAREYLDRRKEAGWTVDPSQSWAGGSHRPGQAATRQASFGQSELS